MLKHNWQTEERDADIVDKVDEEDRGRHKSKGWRELQHPAYSCHQRKGCKDLP